MADTIVLSSSDEELPPKKKAKSVFMVNIDGITITPVPNIKRKKFKKKQSECVLISDDDSDFEISEYKSEMNIDTIYKSNTIDHNKADENDEIKENDETEEIDKSLENDISQESDKTKEIDTIDDNDDCEIVSVKSEEYVDTTKFPDKTKTKEYIIETIEIDDNPKDEENCLETTVTKHAEINNSNISILDIENKENMEFVNSSKINDDKKRNCTNEDVIEHEASKVNEDVQGTFKVPVLEMDNNISSMENSLLVESKSVINELPSDLISLNSSEGSACSKKLTNTDLIETFLEKCKEVLNNSEYDINKKIPILRQYYKKNELKLVECDDFRKLVENNIKKSQVSIPQAVISFGEVYMHLKDLSVVGTVEVTKKCKMKLKKLENTIRLLVKKIKELEDAEIDFSDEEDSSYIQLDRFIARLNKVYHKYCQYLKTNPYSGRITHSKLNFVDSKYNEINRAISKKFKNNKKFPSYFEMETFIKNVLKENKIELTEIQIKTESQHCFKKLGELLQIRRKRELYDSHCLYIPDTGDDPASSNSELQNVLRSNYTKAQNDIEKLCQEYVTKQDHGEEPNVSDDNSAESSDN